MEEVYEPDLDQDSISKKTLSKLLDEWVEEVYEDLNYLFEKDVDRQIADAVLVVFKARNDLEIFKKKALYIYIREMTDCDTPALTRVVNKLKESWYEKYQKLYDLGYLTNNSF
jgi:hypothetical protein